MYNTKISFHMDGGAPWIGMTEMFEKMCSRLSSDCRIANGIV